MTSKLEDVARAISGAPFATKNSLRKARAALEAMKNPTDAQLEKISEAFRLAWWAADHNSRRDAYNAMIDAALEEK